MSRSRHHYVPRFLLARFASRRESKKTWVWQIDAEIGREVSTRDTAVSEHFYGRDTTIEDQLADVEGGWAKALRDAEALDDLTSVSELLREFAWVLAIRGKALRNQFSEFAERMLDEAVDGKHEDAIKATLLKRAQNDFDEVLEDLLSQLPPEAGDQARAALDASPEARERENDFVSP